MRDGRGRRILSIGVVIRVNDTAGAVEVRESTLIGAVERSRALFDD
jgi:hypothetical protein